MVLLVNTSVMDRPAQFIGVLPAAFWLALMTAVLLPFGAFLAALWRIWLSEPEFSYGLLIPLLVTYLLWNRRVQFEQRKTLGQSSGVVVVLAGCGLQLMGSLSGTLIISGIAFVTTLVGIVLYVWGAGCVRVAVLPLALLILMVPVPSYAVGQVSWHLQAQASTVSSAVLRLLSVPVYQDGNLLNLPNYVLEVKQACSGSRSIFALLAMALTLGISVERKWWARVLLVTAAPILAVGANIVRIVGTGLVARYWGALAANESLHTFWGIFVFVIAVGGLLGIQRILQWTTNEYA
jgi:exosortase